MDEYIKSPMNYTGGKYKILKYIIPSFPKGMKNFVDLFAGGLNVGINVDSEKIYVNDQITYLIDLYRFFKNTDTDTLLRLIYKRISFFNLSQTNAEGYKALRDEYNKTKSLLDLFVLSCYSFNHQIRFNSKHEFNTPFGKERSSFNDSIEKNLIRFCDALKRKNIHFSTFDFRDFDFSVLHTGDIVYCDPPYLITTGAYNDGKRGFKDWTPREDAALFVLLDRLDKQGIRFALSNVFAHKGQTNDALVNWSKRYNTFYIDKTYSNCSYHFKDRGTKTVEVLITNYEWEASKYKQTALML